MNKIGHNNPPPPLDPKETIKKNLVRRSKVVDVVPIFDNLPIPTWIELSLIDVCNRKCSFCPKVDPNVAPDTFQKMSRDIIDKIYEQLKAINFDGTISLCGYGEPLLHKDIFYIVKKLSNISKVEIVTNGDVLTVKTLESLYLAKAHKVLISMYDGPEQIDRFDEMTKKANVPKDMVILRDRWYDKHNDFGVKLTNRAGTITTGDQNPINKSSKCFYPAYQFLIDWNGDIFLCPQDWQRRVTMGNMMQESIFKIWSGKTLTKYRKNLLLGKRCDNPCSSCNADGTLLGINHSKKWHEIYKI